MSKNILDLNNDCLLCILKYLPVDSHKNFIKVCPRFQAVWLGNKKLIYKSLELGKTTVYGFERELVLLSQISKYVKHLILNFNRHFVWPEVGLQIVMNILKTMIGLEYATIWIRETEIEESLELFLRTLERLPNIKGIAAYEDAPVVENVFHFRYTDLIIYLPQLEPLTQTPSTKLRLLTFEDTSIRPTMMNLVRHAKNIKEITFWMTLNAEEYIPLMQLPKLELVHVNVNNVVRDYGSMLPLLTAMSSTPQLSSLIIRIDRRIKYIEVEEIAKISKLKYLRCDLAEGQCLKLLSCLHELSRLDITLPSANKLWNMDKVVLNLIRNCPKLELMVMPTTNFSDNFMPQLCKELKELRNPDEQDPLQMHMDHKWTLDQDMQRYLMIFNDI